MLRNMTKEEAGAEIQNMPRLEYGKYNYILIAPVGMADFEPHLVLVYSSPGQIWALLAGYLSGTGKRKLDVAPLRTGRGCTTYITRTIQTDEAQFALIGTGERRAGNARDDECAFSIPVSELESTIKGLEEGHKGDMFRYPLHAFLEYNSIHPSSYVKMRSYLLGEES